MRTIQTIETERYEKVGDTGLLRQIGMITGQEAFDQLEAHLEKMGMLPDEYFLPRFNDDDLKRELPDFRTAVCHTDWGGSEGIYIDIDLQYVENRERKYYHLATGKTLDSSGEAFLRMSRIAAECSMMLNGHGAVVRVPESSYAGFEPQPSLDDLIKSAAGRAAETPANSAPAKDKSPVI